MIEKEKVYQQAIELHGVKAQRIVAIEELSELQKAICKFERNPSALAVANIAEEIADVEIMVEQLKMMFNIQEKVEKVKIGKINRLRNNIEKSIISKLCNTCSDCNFKDNFENEDYNDCELYCDHPKGSKFIEILKQIT